MYDISKKRAKRPVANYIFMHVTYTSCCRFKYPTSVYNHICISVYVFCVYDCLCVYFVSVSLPLHLLFIRTVVAKVYYEF